jgi:hypothetical protein
MERRCENMERRFENMEHRLISKCRVKDSSLMGYDAVKTGKDIIIIIIIITYSVKKLKVARRGLYSTAALCIADCALAPM